MGLAAVCARQITKLPSDRDGAVASASATGLNTGRLKFDKGLRRWTPAGHWAGRDGFESAGLALRGC